MNLKTAEIELSTQTCRIEGGKVSSASHSSVPAFDFVCDQMLFEHFLVRVGHIAFGATEKGRAVQRHCNMDLAGTRSSGLWRFLLVLLLLLAGLHVLDAEHLERVKWS